MWLSDSSSLAAEILELARRAAVHEAAHATFCWRKAKALPDAEAPRLTLVALFPASEFQQDQTMGITCFRERIRWSSELRRRGTGKLWRVLLDRALIQTKSLVEIHLAGPIAEHWDLDQCLSVWRWREAWQDVPVEETSDISAASALVDAFCALHPPGHDIRSEQLIDGAYDAVVAALRDDPRYWTTIKALADTLLLSARHRISGKAAVHVMERAWVEA